MATVEQRVYADSAGRGIAYAAAGVFAGAAPLLLAAQATQGRPAARAALTAATTWAVIAARSLGAAALQIENALTAGDLTRARAALPRRAGVTRRTLARPPSPGQSSSPSRRTPATRSSRR